MSPQHCPICLLLMIFNSVVTVDGRKMMIAAQTLSFMMKRRF